LEPARIKTMLDKYCRFLPISIRFEEKIINNTTPAWTRRPAELTDEDYKNFYKELYPFAEEPLFYIHLNVDYPFNLTGILYFPRLKRNLEIQKNKIQLYCRQVFVTDAVEGIVPDFLTLLHGVIDSPDIPLNVSRSYLQSDGNVKKISNHILKKVADKLEELFKENRTDYEAKWDDIGVFIKYGMLSEEKFYDRAKNFCLLKNTDKKYFTFEEYAQLIAPNQEDKNKKMVYLYSSNESEQHVYIESAKNKGYDVLLFDAGIDPHLVNFLEQKIENSTFTRVDADIVDKLIQKEESAVSTLDEKQQEQLKTITENIVNKEQYHISFEPLSATDAPMLITRPEFMRRMKEMAANGGGYEFMANMGDHYNLILNTNHPLMEKVLHETDAEKQQGLLQQAADLAMLAQGLLKGEALTKFIRRSTEMIQ
jgi:molecular chaperone HtpG